MYELSAVVADFDLLHRCTTAGPHPSPVAVLHRGLGLMPAQDVPGAAPPRPQDPDESPAWHAPAFEAVLARWSRQGPVAYLEAEFFGGTGWQTAAVWQAGSRLWGPAHDSHFRAPRPTWPINHALSLLAPASPADPDAPEEPDLFHLIGLGWERTMDGWRTAGRLGRELGYAAALELHEQRFRSDAESERRTRLSRQPAVLDSPTIDDEQLRPVPPETD